MSRSSRSWWGAPLGQGTTGCGESPFHLSTFLPPPSLFEIPRTDSPQRPRLLPPPPLHLAQCADLRHGRRAALLRHGGRGQESRSRAEIADRARERGEVRVSAVVGRWSHPAGGHEGGVGRGVADGDGGVECWEGEGDEVGGV